MLDAGHLSGGWYSWGICLMELFVDLGYSPPSPTKGSARRRRWLKTRCAPACREERAMSASVSQCHVWLSQLEEELLRARELEAAGKERLDAQEKRVARRKVRRPHSERLLDLMRDTHKLQASHVQLLEKEIREASGQ